LIIQLAEPTTLYNTILIPEEIRRKAYQRFTPSHRKDVDEWVDKICPNSHGNLLLNFKRHMELNQKAQSYNKNSTAERDYEWEDNFDREFKKVRAETDASIQDFLNCEDWHKTIHGRYYTDFITQSAALKQIGDFYESSDASVAAQHVVRLAESNRRLKGNRVLARDKRIQEVQPRKEIVPGVPVTNGQAGATRQPASPTASTETAESAQIGKSEKKTVEVEDKKSDEKGKDDTSVENSG
jgi:hypothetical protein